MGKAKNNASAYQQTQPIDSLPSSPFGTGEEERWKCGDEFEDNAWINDHQYMDTQVIDIGCDNEVFPLCVETQALELGSETQLEPLPVRKQVSKAYDGLAATQLLDDFDDEVVADSDGDVTDVLEDNSELSDSDHCQAETLLPCEENRRHVNEKINSTGSLDSQSNERGISGKVARFTSVRSAAFRASAVAARDATQKFPSSDCFTLVNCHSSGQGASHYSNLEYNVGEVGNQQCPPTLYARNKNDLQAGNRTARKLFLEDSPEENYPSVGLSYIDSQEPGEESQADALNLVDKLIGESCLKFAPEVQTGYGGRMEEKAKIVQCFKGPQELAKKVSCKSGVVGNDTFDWDDNREDEGGGDFYRRRKEELFGVSSNSRKSSTLPRAEKRELIHESHRGLRVVVDKSKAHSDSRLLQHSVTSCRKKVQAAKKNLGKELDDVFKESNDKIFDMREVGVLGNDTQVAAEAIDALCSGERRKIVAEAVCLTEKELSLGEDTGFSNCGVITRQSKGTKRIQAMGKDELSKRRMKKVSPVPFKARVENLERSSEGDQPDKEGSCFSKIGKGQTASRRRMTKASLVPSKACVKYIERSSKGDQPDKEDPCFSKRRKGQTASRGTKKNLVEELDEVSKTSNTRMADRHEEVEVGADTQMAAEGINALHSGVGKDNDPEPNCLIGKNLSPEEGGVSSRGVITRKSKGIKAVDNDVESLKPKTKKVRSVLAKACEDNMDRYSKNEKIDALDEAVVSSTEKRQGELVNKHCTPKLLKQSSRGEPEVLNYPKRRRSACISQDRVNEAGRSSDSGLVTPIKTKMPSKNVSPICMGDEYYRLSSFKSNTRREFRSLTSPLVEPIPEPKSKRKRRDLGSIRVLFSQHLDEDVTKHQKKILARFNISEASSMMEATHFIADNFTRTRNMLEAIASGKPVVTTQWLESIDQVNIYVDEDLYILRDSKKEKEFCFNMGVSLARARQYPLLQGRRVFITSNTKPGLNTITTLVKAVHGLPVERLGRSALNEDKVAENLLVISCEEDRDVCTPFLERGAEVYSSELLLNGIVTQKLEYERYRLFTDYVRRTRSTIWIRDGKGEFQRR